jgi:ribonuclease VapC
MFVDASALVAMLVGEPDADHLALKLKDVGSIITSPLSRYEASLAIARLKNVDIENAASIVRQFVTRYGIRTMNVTEEVGEAAISAFDRFGKGRHKASLNLGDCFSYAFARLHRVPILCKGDDFIHTDIEVA